MNEFMKYTNLEIPFIAPFLCGFFIRSNQIFPIGGRSRVPESHRFVLAAAPSHVAALGRAVHLLGLSSEHARPIPSPLRKGVAVLATGRTGRQRYQGGISRWKTIRELFTSRVSGKVQHPCCHRCEG